jgi:hypothetical protein
MRNEEIITDDDETGAANLTDYSDVFLNEKAKQL